MWDAFKDAATLFLKGKLFRDFGSVVKLTLIGNAVAAILLIVLVKLSLPLWIVIPVVSLVAGALQPWLFKDLKYA